MPKKINLKGMRFGLLLVIEEVGKDRWGGNIWKCKCDCGNEKIIRCRPLITGRTKSCGCYSKKVSAETGRKQGFLNRTYGCSIVGNNGRATKEYRIWGSMKSRCSSPRNKDWKNYGGRGIKICDKWLNSFENFLADMGECPSGCSIDRINNDGNYEPSNCRWATAKIQANNRRKAKENA